MQLGGGGEGGGSAMYTSNKSRFMKRMSLKVKL